MNVSATMVSIIHLRFASGFITSIFGNSKPKGSKEGKDATVIANPTANPVMNPAAPVAVAAAIVYSPVPMALVAAQIIKALFQGLVKIAR